MLVVGAIDRRVKCVVAQVPLISGHENARRLIRSDLIAPTQAMFEADREARYRGEAPMMIPVVAPEGEPSRAADRGLLRVVHDERRRAGAVVDQRVHAAQRRDVLEYEPGHLPAVDLTHAAADGRRGRAIT